MIIPDRVAARLLANADRQPNGCLISRYSVGSHGYAQIGWNEGDDHIVTVAHRAIWIHTYGPIRDGLTLDHICKTKKCVEVTHLRLLSNHENARRTFGRDWPIGECAHGHSNQYLRLVDGGKRLKCGICHDEWRRRFNEKRRLARRR